jgi:GntR family transcriptional regulator/MocR family aminotransferase
MASMHESSRPRDFHVALDPGLRVPLRRQLTEEIRNACRSGRLAAGVSLPSSRGFAQQLAVSRGVVSDAYAQLAAEGYIEQNPRRPPVVLGQPLHAPHDVLDLAPQYGKWRHDRTWRYDLTPVTPDLARFPRQAWAAELREAVRTIPDRELDYNDPRGPGVFRAAVCEYLSRARACDVDVTTTVAVAGFTQGVYVACSALRRHGVTAIAVEDPCLTEHLPTMRLCGLELVAIPVDAEGLRTDLLENHRVQAVLVTPAHQFPTGAVLSPARREHLIQWANDRDAYVIENDYDAEYRYDRAAVGALQGLDPRRVIYIGTASKMLAPALRIGWLHTPRDLLDGICHVHWHLGGGLPVIDLFAFAHLLARGELERHLRRTRSLYQARRRRLLEALESELPDFEIRGAEAGVHLTLLLPRAVDAQAVAESLAAKQVKIETLREYAVDLSQAMSGLLIGYARLHEAQILPTVRLLATALAGAPLAITHEG